eukprot:4494259-Amphidinium_carterae.2
MSAQSPRMNPNAAKVMRRIKDKIFEQHQGHTGATSMHTHYPAHALTASLKSLQHSKPSYDASPCRSRWRKMEEPPRTPARQTPPFTKSTDTYDALHDGASLKTLAVNSISLLCAETFTVSKFPAILVTCSGMTPTKVSLPHMPPHVDRA